jgi:chromosome partitioning protein
MIVAIANQKGGVGKTTTAINLAAALSIRGKSTLLIDLDPQGNSTLSFVDRDNIKNSVYEAFSDPNCSLKEVILPADREKNLSVVPARISLAKLEARLMGELDVHFRLKDLLAPLADDYPYVVIDCPPTLGLLTVNALVAATHLLIPIQSSYFSAQIKKVFGKKVFKTVISKNVRLEESPAYRESIFSFAPNSRGAADYYSLYEEVMDRV